MEAPVTREEVLIQRRPAEGRDATRAEFDGGKEITVPISEERVNVQKSRWCVKKS